ncbi:MAG: RusA family crossover junction endodeoxyribonuclease [Synergistaceae bacterium]|nr:RusA family crossover junction endodeoxyribonuclease [Synergistaceae bacterium]MBQ3695070.1 RusA family crossover junction endodeoxyribonuclease [Synergistaceae bacterium]MBR0250787.1 RusA family crossover junction endodeoxyribonuclease [Synergistaceae bacterium]
MILLDNLSLLDLTLDGLPPTVNHLYHSHGHVRFKSPEGKHYQNIVSNNIRSVWNNKPPYTSPVEFRISFFTNDNKRWDIDNRVKALQDCLSLAGVIRDDSQIHILHVERIHSDSKCTHISLLKCSKEALSS